MHFRVMTPVWSVSFGSWTHFLLSPHRTSFCRHFSYINPSNMFRIGNRSLVLCLLCYWTVVFISLQCSQFHFFVCSVSIPTTQIETQTQLKSKLEINSKLLIEAIFKIIHIWTVVLVLIQKKTVGLKPLKKMFSKYILNFVLNFLYRHQIDVTKKELAVQIR